MDTPCSTSTKASSASSSPSSASSASSASYPMKLSTVLKQSKNADACIVSDEESESSSSSSSSEENGRGGRRKEDEEGGGVGGVGEVVGGGGRRRKEEEGGGMLANQSKPMCTQDSIGGEEGQHTHQLVRMSIITEFKNSKTAVDEAMALEEKEREKDPMRQPSSPSSVATEAQCSSSVATEAQCGIPIVNSKKRVRFAIEIDDTTSAPKMQ
jgi:hypothetical protein